MPPVRAGLAPAPQLTTHNSQLIYPVASINRKALRSLGKCNNAVRDYISKLNSFEDLNEAPYPLDITTTVGSELSHHIIKEYVDGYDDTRKSPVRAGLAPAQNLYGQDTVPVLNQEPRTKNQEPRTKNQEPTTISFDWSLQDIEALNAFRSESFIVANIQSQDSRSELKEIAANAIKEGLTFKEFKQAGKLSLKGLMPENPYHLRTNFNTAINNAHLASQFAQFDKNKDIFPYLRYVAIIDGSTRDEHLELHGIVRLVDDPFWDTYYPPNGWNCRCDVEQLTRDEADADPNGKERTIPPIKPDKNFQKNTYKDRNIWGKWLSDIQLKKYTTTFKELLLRDWKLLKANQIPVPPAGIEKLNKQQLLKYMKTYLNDRTVIDSQGYPILLTADKYKKFSKYQKDDLFRRVKHINSIDDTIKNPDEIWADENKRIKYLKKYQKSTVVLVEFKEGTLEYFNVIPGVRDSTINNLRKGFYLGK